MINILCLFCHPRHTVPEVPALSHHVEQVVQLVDVEEPGGRDIAIGPWHQAPTPKHLTLRPAIPGEHLR